MSEQFKPCPNIGSLCYCDGTCREPVDFVKNKPFSEVVKDLDTLSKLRTKSPGSIRKCPGNKSVILQYIEAAQSSFLSAQSDLSAQMLVADRVGTMRLQVIMDRMATLIQMGNDARKELEAFDD